ncbi:hypothetical protein ABRY23_00370 [Melioribacteraceae bacterium 4301-Me]|uniref:hypothetical protein n=1 Tax=Pyranulibacter aquaticus TaxID=3163344 RepID=UPI003599FBEC
MLNRIFSLIAILLLFTISAYASGSEGKVTGVISGAHCALNGMACPSNHNLTREELPGIFTKDKKFYFITNVPQSFLAQWKAGSEISVEGKIYSDEFGIDAKKISLKESGKWHTVFEDSKIIDDMGHKVSLSDAVVVKDKWYCPKCAMMHEKNK